MHLSTHLYASQQNSHHTTSWTLDNKMGHAYHSSPLKSYGNALHPGFNNKN